MSKALTPETDSIVTGLRHAKQSFEVLFGSNSNAKTPFSYLLARAISRLCLLDKVLPPVHILWLHDMVLGVFWDKDDAIKSAERFMGMPPYDNCTWRKSDHSTRWYTEDGDGGGRSISRLEVETRDVKETSIV